MGSIYKRESVWFYVLTLFLALAVHDHVVLAGDDKSLIGLQGIGIGVGLNKGDVGLTVDQIKKDVELQLQKAGIKILTEEDEYNSPGSPSLIVKVVVLSSHAVHVNAELIQEVTLTRNTGVRIFCTTWNVEEAGSADRSNFKQFVQGKISDSVDKFTKAYLRANPEKQKD